MISGRVCTACARFGLLVCVHFLAHESLEDSHLSQYETRPAVVAQALPPRAEHTHNEFDGSARIELDGATAGGPSTESPPPGESINTSFVVAHQWRERQHRQSVYHASVILPLITS